MNDWKCSGCGTHYPLTVTKCECEKAKPVQIGDGTRVQIPDFSTTKKVGALGGDVYTLRPTEVMGGLPQDDKVYSATAFLRGTMTNVSCNVAGCDCGTSDTPLHERNPYDIHTYLDDETIEEVFGKPTQADLADKREFAKWDEG